MENITHYIMRHKLETALWIVVAGMAIAIGVLLPTAFTHGKATPKPRPTVTTVASWYDQTGKADLARISLDLEDTVIAGQGVSSDLGASNYTAVQAGDATVLEADSSQLASDALLALQNPPPAPLAGNWDKAMRGLTVVGNFDTQAATALQQGQYGKATVYLDMSNAVLTTQVNPALQAASRQASEQ